MAGMMEIVHKFIGVGEGRIKNSSQIWNLSGWVSCVYYVREEWERNRSEGEKIKCSVLDMAYLKNLSDISGEMGRQF